jgi:apolipoprotein N-acyltransferase
MQRPQRGPTSVGRSAFRGLGWILAALAWMGAAALGAVMALVFAATVVVIGLMASVLIALSAAAVRARRSVRAKADPALLEARHVGGHSWVAYSWDGRS